MSHPVTELERGLWAEINPRTCPCHGSGWLHSDWDTSHECKLHGGTPHPEDEREDFDYAAHSLKINRQAYANFRDLYEHITGEDSKAFRALCAARKAGDTPADWVDAAEAVTSEAGYQYREAKAQAEGYSCDLERRFAVEAHFEREEMEW